MRKSSKILPMREGEKHRYLGWKRGQISTGGFILPRVVKDAFLKEMRSRAIGMAPRDITTWLYRQFVFFSIPKELWKPMKDRLMVRCRIDGYILYSKTAKKWFALKTRQKHYAR